MIKTLSGLLLVLSMGAAAPVYAQYSTPVRDVESPDRAAYMLNGNVTLSAPFINGFVTFASFPGKRTFIDQIALRCTTTTNTDVITQVGLLLNTGATSSIVSGPDIVMTRVGPPAFGAGSVYTGSVQVKAFVDPVSATVGNAFYLNIYHTESANTATCTGYVGGHTLTL